MGLNKGGAYVDLFSSLEIFVIQCLAISGRVAWSLCIATKAVDQFLSVESKSYLLKGFWDLDVYELRAAVGIL